MTRWISAALLLGMQCLASESDPQRTAGQGYTFIVPQNLAHVGVGGEAPLYKGLAIGGEVGYLFPARAPGAGAGLLSVNSSYHWNGGTHWKVAPFLTTGYSLAFRYGAANLWNFGGGINYWLRPRVGLRVEYRQYLPFLSECAGFRQFRVGFAFR